MLYLFDIDGTLLTADGAGRRAVNLAAAQLFGVANAAATLQFGGKTDRQIAREVISAHAIAGDPAALIDTLLATYLDHLTRELPRAAITLLPHAHECLTWLAAQADVVIGIATGNLKAGAMLKLEAVKLAQHVRFGGYGCDGESREHVVQAALERGRQLTGTATPAVVIGDTPRDIAAARACGLTVCAVTTGGFRREELAAADAVFASLAELPAWHQAHAQRSGTD